MDKSCLYHISALMNFTISFYDSNEVETLSSKLHIYISLRGWSIPGRGPRNVYSYSKQGEKGQLVRNCRTTHMKMSVYHAALEKSFSFAQICMNKRSFGCC